MSSIIDAMAQPNDKTTSASNTLAIHTTPHGSDVHPASTPPTSPLFVERLATELKLQVLSIVSTKDLLRCRLLNRHMRELIDNPENQVICVPPIVDRARQQLDSFFKTHVDYDANEVDENGLPCGFMNALIAWSKIRGICAGYSVEYALCAHEFGAQWMRRRGIDYSEDLNTQLFSVTIRIHSIHKALHGPGNREPNTLREDMSRMMIPDILAAIGLSGPDQAEAAIVAKVRAGALIGTPIEDTCPYMSCNFFNSPENFHEIVGSEKSTVYADMKRPQREFNIVNDFGEGPDTDQNLAEPAQGRVSTGDADDKGSENPEAYGDMDGGFEASRLAEEISRLTTNEVKSKQSNNRFFMLEDQNNEDDGDDEDEDEDEHEESNGSNDEESGQDANNYVWPVYETEEERSWLTTRFVDAFGVRPPPLQLSVSYYSRSAWAYDIIVAVAKGEKILSMMEKAAVLEDVFLR